MAKLTKKAAALKRARRTYARLCIVDPIFWNPARVPGAGSKPTVWSFGVRTYSRRSNAVRAAIRALAYLKATTKEKE